MAKKDVDRNGEVITRQALLAEKEGKDWPVYGIRYVKGVPVAVPIEELAEEAEKPKRKRRTRKSKKK